MAIMASMQPESGWIILARSNLPFFQRRPGSRFCCAKPVWVAWSGLGQMHLVRKEAGVQGSSSAVSGRIRSACYQFPTFSLGCILLQRVQIILCKTRPVPIWFWLTTSGFDQTDLVKKQLVCKNHQAHFWPVLLSRSGSAANWIQYVCWAGLFS